MCRFSRFSALILCVAACRAPDPPEVALTTARVSPPEVRAWPSPPIESGHHTITARQVFTAQGPCRELTATLSPTYPSEYMLRVAAHVAREPCGDDSPHIGYTAVLTGLPAGSHRLSIVHVGADGRTLAQTVFEHPIVVTEGPAR